MTAPYPSWTAMTELEKECGKKSGNRCDVVTLFAGGQYGLYEYKKYTDIRLVFAPEAGVAALRELSQDRRALDPVRFAHIRRELGLDAESDRTGLADESGLHDSAGS